MDLGLGLAKADDGKQGNPWRVRVKEQKIFLDGFPSFDGAVGGSVSGVGWSTPKVLRWFVVVFIMVVHSGGAFEDGWEGGEKERG